MINPSVCFSSRNIAAFAAAIALISSTHARAQVIWEDPELLYSDESEAYSQPRTGADAATDGAGNVVAVWLRSGVASDPAMKIMRSVSTDFSQTWSAPAVIQSPGSATSVADVDIEYAGDSRWLTLWAIERADSEVVDFYKATSTDLGANWSSSDFVTSQVVKRFFNTFGFPEREPLDIASDGNNTLIATFRGTVLRSVDGGVNWSSFTPPVTMRADLTERDRWSRVAYAGNQQWIHAYHRIAFTIGPVTGVTKLESIYVSRSQDNGLTWSAPTRFDQGYLLLSDLAADDGNALISMDGIVVGDGVYTVMSTSADAGATWEPITPVSAVGEAIVSMSGSNAAALVPTTQTLGLTSQDSGATWSLPAVVLPTDVMVGDIVRGTNGNLMAIYDDRVQQPGSLQRTISSIRSQDNGVTWSPSGEIYQETVIPWSRYNDIYPAVASDGIDTLVATWQSNSSNDQRVMYATSNDGGNSWTAGHPVGSTAEPGFVVPLRAPEVFYGGNATWTIGWPGINNYVMSHSTDNGLTWTAPVVVQTDVSSYEIWDGNNAGTMLGKAVSAGNDWYIRSTDHGLTWAQAEDENYGNGVTSLGGNEWLKIENGKSYLSVDNALTWTEGGVIPGIQDSTLLKVSSRQDGVVMAAAVFPAQCTDCPDTFKVYRSLNKGVNWAETSLLFDRNLTPGMKITLQWLAQDTWLLAAGSNDQDDIWSYSVDNGATWEPFDSGIGIGLTTFDSHALALISSPGPSNDDIYSRHGYPIVHTAANDWQLYR